MKTEPSIGQRNRQLLFKLLAVVAAMFVFAVFAMPPIYDAFCEITGLNGKTVNRAAAAPQQAQDLGRRLTMEFLTDTDKALPWEFRHERSSLSLHPGEIVRADFYVRNRAGHTVVGRAIPSISPAEATQYVKKTECFCFREQSLMAGAEKHMPVIFYVDPAIPAHITTITLSYKFYNLTDKASVASR